MKLVSAIITTHNRKSLLAKAINSVLTQTYSKIELIVVDDASDDGTDLMCLSLPLKYIYIPKEESCGGNHARNIGIMNAMGYYVAFLDDDDQWLPEKIEKQILLMEKGDYELVHCGKYVENISSNGKIKRIALLPNPLDGGWLNRRILYRICCTTTNILVKRQALIDIGMFDENIRFWQEYELSIRLAQRKPFVYVNEPLSIYRVDRNDTQRLTNKYFEWKNTVKQIYNKHENLYKQMAWLEKVHYRGLILFDSAYRCKNAGLYYKAIYYYTQWFLINIFLKIIENKNT